ncbi:MAG: apolipoprotein N-acyltransferase [Microbacteriaceae bacterium]
MPAPLPPRPAPLLPLWAALTAAVGSGILLDLAFPAVSLWVAALPAIALQLAALSGRRAGGAFLTAFAAGTAFYLVDIPWIQQFLGDSFGALSLVPLIGLTVFESLFWGVGGILIALALRRVPRLPGGRLLLPAVVAGLWTLREGVSAVFPFGGFAWGRIGYSQADGPLAGLLPWVGTSGVTFVVVLLVAAAMQLPRAARRLPAATALAALATALVLVPGYPVASAGSLRVAAVQGDGRAGYFDRAASGELLEAQYRATLPLIREGADVDVVVWPEGGSDLDPETDDLAAAAFDAVSGALDAPLVSGVITTRGDETYNSSIVWQHGLGVTDRYDKRHPVPFGEYVPLRSLIEPLVPSLIDLIGREYTPGSTDAVALVGRVTVGLNICFDIVDDALLRETVDDGAQLILAQSNNADFGDSDESLQQLQIARARALETGRSVVVVSTVGTSAVIAPDGRTIDTIDRDTAGTMVDDVPLSTTITPAVAVGGQLEWFLALFGLLTTLLASTGAGGARDRDARARAPRAQAPRRWRR